MFSNTIGFTIYSKILKLPDEIRRKKLNSFSNSKKVTTKECTFFLNLKLIPGRLILLKFCS